MAFGPIMRMQIGKFDIELAPLSREVMGEFITPGMQQRSVTKYLESSAKVLEDEYEWYDKVRVDKDTIVWGIWVRDGDKRTIIGTTSLNGIERDPLVQATSGSMIFRNEYWGNGIASAIHKARTWYAFQQLGLARVKSAVIQGNVASKKALEKSGYTFVYLERNQFFIDGQLRHMDNLECLNPSQDAWKRWWGSDKAPKANREARKRTLDALQWAQENVGMP